MATGCMAKSLRGHPVYSGGRWTRLETPLHLPEKMEKLAGDRQPLVATLEQKKLFFRILAQYPGHRIDVDNCTAMNLPEAVRIEFGEQFLQGRSDQRLRCGENDARVLGIGLEV